MSPESNSATLDSSLPYPLLSERDLCVLILDLFFAGSETTASTLTFMFYYLANHPEIQKKLQAEIDLALPKGTLATLEDRIRYLNFRIRLELARVEF